MAALRLKVAFTRILESFSRVERHITPWINPTVLLLPIPFLLILILLVLAVPKDPSKYLILISACVIMIGYFFNSAVKLHSEIRDKTIQFLMENRSDLTFAEAERKLSEFFRLNPMLQTDDMFKLCFSMEEEYVQVRKHIQRLGNFYEELYTVIKYREVNEAILEDFYAGLVKRFYESIQSLIPVIRNSPPIKGSPLGQKQRPDIFVEVTALYNRWNPRYEANHPALSN